MLLLAGGMPIPVLVSLLVFPRGNKGNVYGTRKLKQEVCRFCFFSFLSFSAALLFLRHVFMLSNVTLLLYVGYLRCSLAWPAFVLWTGCVADTLPIVQPLSIDGYGYDATAARCTKSKVVGKYDAWYNMLLPTCCAPRIFCFACLHFSRGEFIIFFALVFFCM